MTELQIARIYNNNKYCKARYNNLFGQGTNQTIRLILQLSTTSVPAWCLVNLSSCVHVKQLFYIDTGVCCGRVILKWYYCRSGFEFKSVGFCFQGVPVEKIYPMLSITLY